AELTRRIGSVSERLFANVEIVVLHNVLTMPFNLAGTSALWQVAEALPQTRFIGWVHDLAFCNPDFDFPHAGCAPWSLLAAAHPQIEYIAVSEHRRQQFETLTGVSCEVIPNGIDPIAFLGLSAPVAKLADERKILENDLVLLHPARVVKRKNIELGLRLTAAL